MRRETGSTDFRSTPNFDIASEARFIRRISAVSNSMQRIKFDRNSASESAAAFLPHVRLGLSHYPAEMRHRFKRRISAVSNLIHTLCLCIEHA